ncbi:response regulator transcription factor [Candidatus Gracilibacteria bacterium]|jgi:DNA-binding NarL/FixJ family response regulator|nr:response regulator transcription factor [Candidatus Gracilibacteria bacterium]NJM87931.1 response regulator transcription factor [Hydrococcus sp. RU_2_2]NJP20015.1 response regulator transcription factor [Hydrococcus sp. CRU_1_1]NJQ98788.1 response regulator transcription factor [Hydrococcus sp. CSU_1_8]
MSDKSKLLLVDDEPGVRESVQAYLEDSDEFKVKVASNANEAWDFLQRETPDLVISDIMMPQVDGYQFLKQLREDPRFKTLPVVFLTARGMTSDRIQGYDAGCDAYLPKPFDPDELESIVKNVLKRRKIATEANGEAAQLAELLQDVKTIKEQLGHSSHLVPTPAPIKIELTPREQSVLDLVAEGLMNKEIASRLDTSVRNVEKYVSRLFSKTGTNSRTELVRFALKHGLTS